MSRFADGDENFPGQWWLWEQALNRAVNGAKGQRVLRDLEQALLDLPTPRLIEGRLSDGAEVCAVGAFVTHQRVKAGETRKDVLEHLRKLAGSDEDWIDTWEAEESTILEARRAGMQLSLACTISSLNDDLYGSTPEQRYAYVLGWAQARLLDVSATTAANGEAAQADRERSD